MFLLHNRLPTHSILLHKVVKFFFLQVKMLITTKPILTYLCEILLQGQAMVLGHSIHKFKSLEGFKLFSSPSLPFQIQSP